MERKGRAPWRRGEGVREREGEEEGREERRHLRGANGSGDNSNGRGNGGDGARERTRWSHSLGLPADWIASWDDWLSGPRDYMGPVL